jgi:restriction system protein
MAIPGFQSIMLPLLKIASDESEHNHTEVRDSLAAQFEISDSEKNEMLPSGKQARFSNRVAWAIVYLRGAGLIENSSRGIFHITEYSYLPFGFRFALNTIYKVSRKI